MDEIKELLKSLVSMAVKNSKDEAEDEKKDNKKEVDNENVDKRKLIDEVGGILKGKVDDEIIRTIIGKLEKVAYDKSEKGTADNEAEKSVKEMEKETEEKTDEKVENKCKKANNSKDDEWYGKLSKIYNSIDVEDEAEEYVSRFERLEAGKKYFEK